MNKWKCRQCGHTYASAGYFSATCPKCRSTSATRIDEPIHRVGDSPGYTPIPDFYSESDTAPTPSSDFSGGGGDFGGGGASGDY